MYGLSKRRSTSLANASAPGASRCGTISSSMARRKKPPTRSSRTASRTVSSPASSATGTTIVCPPFNRRIFRSRYGRMSGATTTRGSSPGNPSRVAERVVALDGEERVALAGREQSVAIAVQPARSALPRRAAALPGRCDRRACCRRRPRRRASSRISRPTATLSRARGRCRSRIAPLSSTSSHGSTTSPRAAS